MNEPKLSIWEQIKEFKAQKHCKCPLRKGMTWWDLLALGTGCGNEALICPVLARYRDKVGYPAFDDSERLEAEQQLALIRRQQDRELAAEAKA